MLAQTSLGKNQGETLELLRGALQGPGSTGSGGFGGVSYELLIITAHLW